MIDVKWGERTLQITRGTQSAGEVFGDRAKDYHFALMRKTQDNLAQAPALLDLYNRPLQASCELEGIAFDQDAFWHSSAHILGYAVEMYYKEARLTVGPATDDGFFYDFWLPKGEVASLSHFKDLEKIVKGIIKSKHRFERLDLTKEQALDMFSEN